MEYVELFKLCNFSEEEIRKESPRIDKAFQKARIDEEDVDRATARIKEFYNVELEGVRMLLGVWMKEFIALMLCREENRKVIYSEWPGPGNTVLMGALHSAKDCYFGTPASQCLNIVLGSFFDKLRPLLETGEENGLPPGAADCALWQTHVGAIAKGLIPKPDLMISSGWYCDIPCETDQLLEVLYDIPTFYVDGCLDFQWGEWPDIGMRQVKYTGGKLRKLKKRIEDLIGCEITDEHQAAGFQDQSTLYFNYQTLTELFAKADPQPISQTNLDLAFYLFYTPTRYRPDAIKATTFLARDLMHLVKEGKGIVPKGAPRVYFFLRCAVDPSLLRMMENAGLNLSLSMIEWLPPGTLEMFKSTDNSDLMMEGVYRLGGIVCGGQNYVDYIVRACEHFKVEAALMNYMYSCRPVATPVLMAKDALQKRLGIPVMVLEFDSYDSRQYSAGQLRTRVEAFAEMLKQRKAAALA